MALPPSVPHNFAVTDTPRYQIGRRRSRSVLDDGMVYWDVHPSARFLTVEVRVADVPSTVAETVLLATLIGAAAAVAGGARSAEPQLGNDRSRRLL
jgi:gamma-glutamyl:cysteine ligase YbdK (ATP-grasp superfamily)